MTLYRTLNPTTEILEAEFPTATDAQLEIMLAASFEAFKHWRQTGFAERAAILRKAAGLLERDASLHAAMMAREMGKPLAEGDGESRKCATACRYYAEHGEAFMQPVAHASDAARSGVCYEPLGPVLAIMPWNFPFWQVFRFLAPALMAGNAAIIKHAPNTPQCALRIVELLREAGLPEGVVQNAFLSNEQAALAIADRRVRGVTLTGSTAAGRAVGAAAGRALKPVVLELGGSDPFIVFADADVTEAAKIAAFARCLNGGQSCIAAKRFLIEAGAYDTFLALFTQELAARPIGDPTMPETRMGPLARADLREQLAAQVKRASEAGATVHVARTTNAAKGYFHPAIILTNMTPENPVWKEELFGPVAIISPFQTEAEAIELANDSDHGLGASVWTADTDRANRLVGAINAGGVFINGFVKSDPRLPFGGIKDSGFGRELGREGVLEFCNQKTFWIK